MPIQSNDDCKSLNSSFEVGHDKRGAETTHEVDLDYLRTSVIRSSRSLTPSAEC